MSIEAARARRLTRPKEPPEDSLRLRVVVAAMVLVALAAVIAQGATDVFTSVGALLLVPAGYAFSYVQRTKANTATKVMLAVALLAAFGAFLQNVRYAQTVDQARMPLASLFVWVQVLHSFDVPHRRDLAFSATASLILLAEAGSLSLGTGFLVFLVPWIGLAAAWLYLSHGPRPFEVTAPAFVRRYRPDRDVALAAGRSVLAIATVAATIVAVVFVLIPRLPGAFVRLPPFAVRNALAVPAFKGAVVNPGLPAAGGDGVVDFSSFAYPGFGTSVDLRARGHLSDHTVMYVRSPQAALWRGQAYDRFDGTAWTETDPTTATMGQSDQRSFLLPPPEDGLGTATRHIVTTFYVQAEEPNIVFAAYAPEEVFFPAGQLSVDRSSSIRAPILLDRGLVYSVISDVPVTSPAELRATPASWPADVLARYTQLPLDLPLRDIELARRITAGATNTYDRVMAVQGWLQRDTKYNVDIPRDPPGVDAVDEFLFVRREGFCEHIASAMAVLLRAAGVPTRFVTGFGPGERNPFTGYYDVRESDAHAWVEVLYPDLGWVPYDPTFGVPDAAPGVGSRFIAPQVIRAIGGFIARVVPAPVKELARAIGSAIAGAARGVFAVWPIALVFLVALLAVALGRHRRRDVGGQGPPLAGAARAFADLARAMARRGHARMEHQTPEEFLRSVRPFLPDEDRADAEAVVRSFERARFSGRALPPDEAEAALAAARRIGERAGRDDPVHSRTNRYSTESQTRR